MKAIFIDESKAKDFILCAVEVDISRVPSMSRSLRKLTLRGQSRIHFVSEGPRRRKSLISHYEKLPLAITLFRVRGFTDLKARNQAIESMISKLNPNMVYQIWIERDENHVQSDKSTLAKAIWGAGLADSVLYSHADSKSQPLLWLPDAFAWLANRGGDWAKELGKFQVATVIIS